MVSESQKTYGKLANIFILGKYPTKLQLPPPPAQPWNDENDPGAIQREYIKQKVIAVRIEEDNLRLEKSKLFGFIKQHLSTASLTQVKRHVIQQMADLALEAGINPTGDDDDFEEETFGDADEESSQGSVNDTSTLSLQGVSQGDAPTVNTLTGRVIWDDFEAEADPLKLWKAIHASHQTARLLSSRLDQDKAVQNYSAIKQGESETLDSFKLRFDNALDTLTAVNLKIPKTRLIVTRFIESLNSDYNELRKDIKNSEYRGRKDAWPETLDQVYIYATKYLTNEIVAKDERMIALVTPASVITDKRKKNRSKNKTDSTKKEPTRLRQELVSPILLLKEARAVNNQSNQSNANNPTSNPSCDTAAKLPKKPCILCKELHWISECKFLEGVQERISNREIEARVTVTRFALLSNAFPMNEIVIDNASNSNIFRNRNLLTNIQKLDDPIPVGGVNKNGEPLVALERRRYGPFKNVLYHPDSVGNILSRAKARDEFHLTYDSHDGTVHVDCGSEEFTFNRKGDFYIFDHSERCLLFKRQTERVSETKLIQSRLGYPGITEMYNTVKLGGINNIPITSN